MRALFDNKLENKKVLRNHFANLRLLTELGIITLWLILSALKKCLNNNDWINLRMWFWANDQKVVE